MTRPHRLAQVLAVDPNFEVVTAAYPYVARSLLADRSAKSRRALLELILDTTGRVRWTRLNACGYKALVMADAPECEGQYFRTCAPLSSRHRSHHTAHIPPLTPHPLSFTFHFTSLH